MSPLFLCSLLLFLSMHACNARILSLFDKETRKPILNTKELDKVNLYKTSNPSQLMSPIIEELGAQVGNDDQIKHKSLRGASTMGQKNLETFWKEEEDRKSSTSGNNVIVPSQINLQQEAKLMEDLKWQGRSMLGSGSKDAKEDIESKENDIVEDVVVMDYAQPHRKPPIHNEKP